MYRQFLSRFFPAALVVSIGFSAPIVAAPLGFFPEENETRSVPLFGLTPDNNLALKPTANPNQALNELERRLQENADFESILAHAPALEAKLPNSGKLQWLLTLALAADGQLTQAIEKQKAAKAKFPDQVLSAPALLASAMIARRSANLATAQQLTESVLRTEPQNPYAHNMLGMVETARNDLESAAKSFATAANLAPGSQTYQLNLGVTELNRNNPAGADTALNAALALNPQDCGILTATAQLRALQLDLAAATNLMETCLQADPASVGKAAFLVDLLVQQNMINRAIDVAKENEQFINAAPNLIAELHLKLDRPFEAREALNAAVQDDPQTAVQRSIIAALQGKAAQALDLARSHADQNPTARATLNALALSIAVGEPFEAPGVEKLMEHPVLGPVAAFFHLLAALDSNDGAGIAAGVTASENFLPGVRYEGLSAQEWRSLTGSPALRPLALATLYHLRDLPQPAKRELLKVEELSPTSALPSYLLAIVASGLGDDQLSTNSLEKALEQQPDFYAANLLMGETMIGAGDLARATLHFEKATQVVQELGPVFKLGVFADAQGDVDLAEKALRQAIDLQPEWFATYNQLAWVFIQREIRLEEAEALALKADSLQPGNAAVLDNLGWIKHLRGETDEAVTILRRANDISRGSNFDILLHLALAEEAAGDPDAAKTHARSILQVADAALPQAVEAQALVDRIETR